MTQASDMQTFLNLVWLQLSGWACTHMVPPTCFKHVHTPDCKRPGMPFERLGCLWMGYMSDEQPSEPGYCRVLQSTVLQSTAQELLQSCPSPQEQLGGFYRGQASSSCSQPLSVAQRQDRAEGQPAGSRSIDCFLAPSCVTYSPSRASSTGTAPNSKTSSCCRAEKGGSQLHTVNGQVPGGQGGDSRGKQQIAIEQRFKKY